MKHNLHRAGLFRPLLLVLALLVGSGGARVWAETQSATINFGTATGSIKINAQTVTGSDALDNQWTITTDGTTSFTQSASYSQVGSSNAPATSITFTTTLPATQTVTAFSARFGGFNNTAGTVTLKVGDTTVGTGSLNATNDVTVSSTSTGVGTVLTVTVTGIAKGVKCYSISYTYEESSSPSLTASDLALTGAPVALEFDLYNNSAAQTVSFTTNSTGAVTVSGGTGYVTTSVSGNTITVTPTAVTPSAQTITVSQAADDTYAAGSATFTVTVDDSTPTPTHTVTFSVNGSTTSSDVEEGAAITFPSNPEAVNGKVFVGWAAAAIDGTTNTAPTFVTSATMGNADVTYYAVFATLAASGEPVETKFQTLQYDTWTYSGTTADKTSYRLFGSGSYVESAAFDLSKLSKVIVYGGTYGGATNNSLTIGDGTNTWKTVTVSGSSQTGANTYTDGTALTGTNKLRITSNSGNASSTGVRISKVEIYITESQTSYSDYCTTVVAASVEAPAINVAETFEGSNSIEATITCATEGATIYYSYDGQNWTEYTGALTITTTTTIYAKATKGSDESTVVSKTTTMTVATPTFSLAAGTYTESQSVTLACATDGATIYYTCDGDDPTTASMPYAEPIPVDATITIKAIAVKNGVSSTVASATYTINVPSTISAVRAQGTGSVFTKGVVTSCSGTTAYIQDAAAAICVYGTAMTVGDEVTVSGTLTTYNGLMEITSPTVTVLSSGNSVLPTTKTIAEINTDYSGSNTLQGWLVKIENATVSAINNQNVTLAQGENTIVARFSSASAITCAVNDVVSLTANIGCYNAAQLANPTNVTVVQTVATPTFSPEAGTYTSAQSVTITCATEGATIYYTMDGNDPTTESMPYTEAIPVDATVTIKAIAVKEGMTNSAVATVVYTIDLTPTVTIDGLTGNAVALEYDAGARNDIHFTATNTIGTAVVTFCDSEGGALTADPDWITASIDGAYIHLTWEANDGDARTAYLKVMADNATSQVITVTQAKFVVDYATLPFEWEGGTKNALLALAGVTANGLGSDYADSNAPYRVKLDGEGDYIQIKTDSQPGVVTVGVKMIGGANTSTLTVQESSDGQTFTDVEDLTISGTQNAVLSLETTNAFAADTRYVKILFSQRGSNVGVGPITITNYVVPEDYTITLGTVEDCEIFVFDYDDQSMSLVNNGDQDPVNSASVLSGTTIGISASALDDGYFPSITVTDGSGQTLTLVGPDDTDMYTFTMPASNVTIDATAVMGCAINFRDEDIVNCTLSVYTDPTDPDISALESNQSVAPGSTVYVKATPDDGYGTPTITVLAGDTPVEVNYANGVYSFTADYDVDITATATALSESSTLPFSWAGGASADLTAQVGVTAYDLGSDYASNNAPYLVKLDGTGDYIQVKTDSQPGKVTVGVKMIGGGTSSTITVQESADGSTFTDVETLTISGSQNAVLSLETTESFAADTRYVRLLFTKGSNVGVGPITIAVPGSSVATVATPTFSVAAGTYTSAQSVELACETEGATIYYTIDDSEPTDQSTEYTGAISVSTTTTIKAIAVKQGLENSEVATATYTIDLTPSIVFDGQQNPANEPCIAGSTNIHYVASNLTDAVTLVICDADGNATTYDWFSAELNGNVYVHITWEANPDNENTRTAYFKLVAGQIESDIFSVTQAEADYATLPFEWEGGTSSELTAVTGVTAYDLGSDYASNNSPYLVKLDGDGDYIQVKTDSQPGKVTIGVKMIGGGNTSTITVQESADGSTFTDVETLTISGSQNAVLSLETTESFAAETRYVRLLFTKGSNVGVGPLTIAQYVAPTPAITPEATTVNLYAVSYESEVIKLTYNFINTETSAPTVVFCDANGDATTYDWISDATVADSMLLFNVAFNQYASARTAYMKVQGISTVDGAPVYSPIITVTQNAPEYFYVTLDGLQNIDLNVFDTSDYDNRLDFSAGPVLLLGGTTIAISPDPAPGYILNELGVFDDNDHDVRLSGPDESDLYTFELTCDVTIRATAEEIITYTVRIEEGENCTLNVFTDPTFALESGDEVLRGTRIYVSATPDDGYDTPEITVMAGDDELPLTYDDENEAYYFILQYDVIISAVAAVPAAPSTYALATTITSGKHYIIVGKKDEGYYAMGGQNSNSRAAVEVELNGDRITSNSDVEEFVIYGPYADGNYAIYTEAGDGGYLYAASSSSNYLRTEELKDANGSWEIAINAENGSASVTAKGTNTRNTMQFNSTSTLFACYGSDSQQPVYLYEKDNDVLPEEKPFLSEYGYATWCSKNPLYFAADDEVSAWKVTGVQGENITFERLIGTVPGGTGILLKGQGYGWVTLTSASEVPNASAADVTGNLLVGVADPLKITSGQYYGLYETAFRKLGAGTVPDNRAILPQSISQSGVKAFTFVFNEGGIATGINELDNWTNYNSTIYNLNGQRLAKPQKGFNIINGKKVLFK